MTTKSLMIACSPAQSGENFSTSFTPFGNLVITVAESAAQFPCLTAFTLSLIGVSAVANNASGAVTYKSRINSAAGNCSFIVPSNTTGWFSDTTHSDSVTSGQTFDLQRNSLNASTFNPKLTIVVGVASASSPLMPQIVADGTGHSGQFQPPFGGFNLNGVVETAAQEIVSAAATWKGFGLKTSAAATSTNSSTSRKNGATGNQTISIVNGTASGTAIQDTTHSDSIVAGDNLATSWGGPNCQSQYSEFAGSTSAHNNGTMQNTVNGNSLSASTTYFWNYAGAAGAAAVAETIVQLTLPYGLKFSQLRVRLSNNVGISATCVSRKNTADGNCSLTIASNATGEFSDTTHSDTCVTNDLIAAKFVTSAGTSMGISSLRGQFDDGSVTGGETGTAVLSWTGFSFTGSAIVEHTGTGKLAWTGFSFAGVGAVHEGSGVLGWTGFSFTGVGAVRRGTGLMSWAGFSFSSSGSAARSAVGVMAWTGFSFVATAHAAKSGTAVMSWAGFSIDAFGYRLGPAGTGLRQFWSR